MLKKDLEKLNEELYNKVNKLENKLKNLKDSITEGLKEVMHNSCDESHNYIPDFLNNLSENIEFKSPDDYIVTIKIFSDVMFYKDLLDDVNTPNIWIEEIKLSNGQVLEKDEDFELIEFEKE